MRASHAAIATAPPCAAAPRDERALRRIALMNKCAAALHALLFALVVATGNAGARVQTVLIEYSALRPETSGRSEWALQPVGFARTLQVHLTPAVAAFFGVTALFHALNAWGWRCWYEHGLADCRCARGQGPPARTNSDAESQARATL